jgi:transketolase
MRDAFFNSLEKLMAVDRKIVFITADLGFKLFDKISLEFPDRVINVGVRESSMIGLAAGLSKEGFLPFVYSIAPFSSFRCIEQIRVDLCYNNLSCIIVGVGGGLAYGPNGPTHMGIDDIGAMSALSNMVVISPCDPTEVKLLLPQAVKLRSPVYLRLARNGEPDCHKTSINLPKIFNSSIIKEGRDAVIFSHGAIMSDILHVVNELKKEGRGSIKLVSCHTLKPLKEKMILSYVKENVPVIVIEENFASGSLGSQVALILQKSLTRNPFLHLHLPDKYPDVCGDRGYLLGRSKLSRSHLKKYLSGMLKSRRD